MATGNRTRSRALQELKTWPPIPGRRSEPLPGGQMGLVDDQPPSNTGRREWSSDNSKASRNSGIQRREGKRSDALETAYQRWNSDVAEANVSTLIVPRTIASITRVRNQD